MKSARMMSLAPLFATVFSGAAGGHAAQHPGAALLAPGVPMERELSGGQSHEYRIALNVGQFVAFSLDVERIVPAIAVIDPAGGRIEYGVVNDFSIVADTPGSYLLRVRARDQTAPAGRYVVKGDPPYPAGARERARAAGDRTLAEGKLAAAKGGVASLRAAIAKYKAALEAFRQAEHRPGEIASLFLTGDSYRRLRGETSAAREYLDKVVALARTARDRSSEANAVLALGLTYSAPADQKTGLEYLTTALSAFEELGDSRGQSRALASIGMAWAALDESPKAFEHYRRALTMADAVNDRDEAARILNELAVLQINSSQLPEALNSLRRAVELTRAISNRDLEFMVIYNMGIAYKELGDYRRALDSYTESLALIRALGNASREAQCLNAIGTIYRNQGEHRKSLEQYGQALAIFRRLENQDQIAAVLNNIGAAYFEIGQPQVALEYHQQSRTIRQSLGDRRAESLSLLRAGRAWHSLGRTPEALDALRESLAIRREAHDPIGEAETLLNLAAVERDRGDLTAAQTSIEAALSITEALRARITDAGLRASYIARVQETYESYVDVLMQLHGRSPAAGYDAAALEAAERMRARVLLESLAEARAGIREGVDVRLLDAELELQRKLDAASQRLSRTLSGKPAATETAAARQDLEQLTEQHRKAEADIRLASPRYASLTQPEPLTLQQIQRDVLDVNSVLLEFVPGEARSWLLAVTAQTIAGIELPGRQVLEAAARAVYDEMTARQPRDRESPATYARRVAAADARLGDRAATLGRMLFGGIADRLTGPWRGKRLVIVAGGALEYVPFAALPLPQAGDPPSDRRRTALPLMARHEIVEVPSATVLASLRREAAGHRPPQRTVAVLADPVFEREDPRVAGREEPPTAAVQARGTSSGVESAPWMLSRAIERMDDVRGTRGLSRLPFSRDEADAIASLAGAQQTLRATDFKATRSAVLGDALGDYRILHFATHGLIDAERPELSALILSLVDPRGTPQDGLLRLPDIFNMRLNADLVVLSACQTALGKEIKGEGLVGLTRGFMYAGAPRVVASLWQVSDLATAELMKKFYTGLLRRRLSPAAALRAAQLEMARDPRWSAPYFWAGFVLQGDWK